MEVLLRMDAQIQALSARVARQDERIAQLERRLNRSSRNFSTPPSADPPAAAPKRGKDSSGRKQGAQPGHEGRGRPLLPAWAVDRVIEHWPDRCGCGYAFAREERVAVGEPVRWQVEELPVISVVVTEHRCHRVCCPGCGERWRAELPREVAQSAFGPRFQGECPINGGCGLVGLVDSSLEGYCECVEGGLPSCGPACSASPCRVE